MTGNDRVSAYQYRMPHKIEQIIGNGERACGFGNIRDRQAGISGRGYV